jgi:hypothetical protein
MFWLVMERLTFIKPLTNNFGLGEIHVVGTYSILDYKETIIITKWRGLMGK